MTDRINNLLEDIRLQSEDRYAIVQRLRSLIGAVAPAATEEVKYGGFLFSAAEPVCGAFSYSKHVSLELTQGAALSDPHQVLEGSGKLRRHIKLRSVAEVAEKHVEEYVRQAFATADSM